MSPFLTSLSTPQYSSTPPTQKYSQQSHPRDVPKPPGVPQKPPRGAPKCHLVTPRDLPKTPGTPRRCPRATSCPQKPLRRPPPLGFPPTPDPTHQEKVLQAVDDGVYRQDGLPVLSADKAGHQNGHQGHPMPTFEGCRDSTRTQGGGGATIYTPFHPDGYVGPKWDSAPEGTATTTSTTPVSHLRMLRQTLPSRSMLG